MGAMTIRKFKNEAGAKEAYNEMLKNASSRLDPACFELRLCLDGNIVECWDSPYLELSQSVRELRARHQPDKTDKNDKTESDKTKM